MADTTNENQMDTPEARCFIRAKARGQRTFTLVAQDLSAPAAIAHWIEINISNDITPDEKLREALEDALAMRRWINRKHPD